MKKLLFLGFIAWLSQGLVGSQPLSNKIRFSVHDKKAKADLYRSLASFCAHNQINELKDILKKEIHPDRIRISEGKYTLTIQAAKHKQYDVLKILLEEGKADPNIQDAYGNTAVMHAVDQHDQKALDILLQAHANVDVQNNKGNTALLAAIILDNQAAVIQLLRARAHVNVQNKIGRTALMVAAHRNQHEVVAMLLKAHADPEIIAKDGVSAFYFAIENENEVIFTMLQEVMTPGLSDSEEDIFTMLQDAMIPELSDSEEDI